MAVTPGAWLVDTRTRGMAMGLFLITFDLKDASEVTYERIYEWAHRVGGYRYFRFDDGKWGRLPWAVALDDHSRPPRCGHERRGP